ncbi:hypothetical protein TsFJ059_001840 [Trichoderma semiorbis]|uniref:G domain-containing protein n=1 Tax=Trichoderma semiorbis TaxID=1491008 RepID=A0A9P8HT49_9HYPO|nr:hypothetical protein TsFJ059_001840 [Trichoderma semiorbis]
MSDPNNYTVGWISAIEIEYTAAQEFLDEEHDQPRRVHQNDENHYTLGKIGKHNVVIAVLPRGDNGVAAAAMAAKDMMHSFPNVRVCLMVGIGGGAPSGKHDIRLGDVVVSVPTFSGKGGNQGGVVQYDYAKTIQERRFHGTKYLNRPPRALLTAVNGLSAKHRRKGNNIDTTINNILQKNRRLQREYGRPAPDSDKLYLSDPVETLGADKVPVPKLIERHERSEMEDNPAIHYGLIASADNFMEDALIRDILAKELDVLCFEMEAAGLMNSFPCLVIRGICDYSDRHWSKGWRGYAAMAAAAYAKALLQAVPVSDVDSMQAIKDGLPPDFFGRAKSLIAPFWGDKKKEAVSVSVIPDPEETQVKDRSKDQPDQKSPIPPTVTKSSVTGDVDPEETQINGRNKDQPLQTSPTQAAVAQSPIMGSAESEETQTKDRSKYQPCQMPLNRTDVAQSLTTGGIDPEETLAKDRGQGHPYEKPPIPPTVAQSPVSRDVDPEEAQANGRSKDQPHRMPLKKPAKPPPAKTGFTSSQSDIEHVYIAVMGVTGAGKSYLISLCTGKNVKVGHNLESCTADVEDVEFMLNDHVCVHLIDTPGFDDTSRSDVEVLQNIAVWLTDSIKHNIKLSGIIYLHRIIDVRMAGSTLRNLSMFKKLCGENAYSSVVLATSMWSQVDEDTGAQREQELIKTKKFWGHMHEKGSRIFRLDQTRESCLKIIKYIISLGSTTLLELQDEIVYQGRQIEDTEAGVQLNQDIIRERKKHQAELLALKTQMQEIAEMAEHDAELQRALKEEYDELKENIRRSDEEQAKLKQDLKDVHERKERELLELKKEMEAERKRYDEDQKRQAEEHEALIQKVLSMGEALERQAQEDTRRAEEDARRVRAWADHHDTPLHLAVQDGKADVVESLLMQGANIEAKDKYGGTPLFDAVRKGNEDMAKLLLDRGADIEAKNKEGRTPLCNAVCNRNMDMTKLLLNRGADIDAEQTSDGWTILHTMVAEGNADTVKFLLDHEANIEAKVDNGCTPFGLAIEKGKENMAKLLLYRGADIDRAQRKNGATSLHVMAEFEKADMVQFLLNHGADIEAKNDEGRTPLGVAILHRKKNWANILLNRGANIEARQRVDCGRILHVMAANGDADMVDFLLDHGADIRAADDENYRPRAYARGGGFKDVEKLLKARGG